MSRLRGVICDFGGVLTTPLHQAFAAMQEGTGVSNEDLMKAMLSLAERGPHPLFELETGRISEPEFLDGLSAELTQALGREVELRAFGRRLFEHLHPNHELIELMRSLRGRGLRMAILTNNVREWEPLWRPMLPVDEIFHEVVDSAWVGMRKPDPRVYELTLKRIALPASACLFIDDTDVNCHAARDLGMTAVWFQHNRQAIPEIGAALDGAATS